MARYLKIFTFILYVRMLRLHTCVCVPCVFGSWRGRRGRWLPGSWSYRSSWVAMCDWESNQGPLEEQEVLQTTEHLSSPSQVLLVQEQRRFWCGWEVLQLLTPGKLDITYGSVKMNFTWNTKSNLKSNLQWLKGQNLRVKSTEENRGYYVLI